MMTQKQLDAAAAVLAALLVSFEKEYGVDIRVGYSKIYLESEVNLDDGSWITSTVNF